MNKLKLDLDTLAVESFDTATARKEDGTVFGEQCTCNTHCTCPGCESCDNTCPYTCDDYTCGGGTCEGTCGGECMSQWETCPAICPV
jgi:hypothetical protein